MKSFLYLALAAVLAAGAGSAILPASTANAQSTESAAAPTPTPEPGSTPPPRVDDPNEVITVDTELVNLNIRVVDRNNRPISGLRQAEFKIFEDNVEQQI